MLAAAFIAFSWSLNQTVLARREVAYEQADQDCRRDANSKCDHVSAMRSAEAAEVAADYSGLQLWLNAFGLLGLAATVVYARAAWVASHRSAEIAQRALEHGRAYIVAEIGGVSQFEVGKPVKASLIAKNVGQTPANNVSTAVTVEFIRLGTTGEVPDWHDVARIHLVIGPTLEKRVSRYADAPLTEEQRDIVKARNGLIVVGGTVVYEDIFGKTWWTQFCHTYTGEKLEGTYHTELNRSGGPI